MLVSLIVVWTNGIVVRIVVCILVVWIIGIVVWTIGIVVCILVVRIIGKVVLELVFSSVGWILRIVVWILLLSSIMIGSSTTSIVPKFSIAVNLISLLRKSYAIA